MTESLGDKAERLTLVALDLAQTVRDEPRDDIEARLRDIDAADKDALLVILAALVDIDRPASQLLSWVTWDDQGRPLRKAS
jgi:hypothetical protein